MVLIEVVGLRGVTKGDAQKVVAEIRSEDLNKYCARKKNGLCGISGNICSPSADCLDNRGAYVSAEKRGVKQILHDIHLVGWQGERIELPRT